MNEAKALWNQLVVRWRSLSSREQWLMAGGGISIVVWLIWQGVVAPMDEQQRQSETRLAASKAQLLLIQQQASEVLALRAGGAKENTSANRPMDQIIHQTARGFQIAIQRVQIRGEMLDIDLGDVPFEKLLQWLVEIEQNYRIRVRDIQLEATATSGTVEVSRLQLERG